MEKTSRSPGSGMMIALMNFSYWFLFPHGISFSARKPKVVQAKTPLKTKVKETSVHEKEVVEDATEVTVQSEKSEQSEHNAAPGVVSSSSSSSSSSMSSPAVPDAAEFAAALDDATRGVAAVHAQVNALLKKYRNMQIILLTTGFPSLQSFQVKGQRFAYYKGNQFPRSQISYEKL